MKTKAFLGASLACMAWLTGHAQAVIFPQQAQPGAAACASGDNSLTLGNDLFTATYIQQDGKLTFGGAPALGLLPGTELFSICLGDGTTVNASEMTLTSLNEVSLTADPDAPRGSERFDGKAIEGTFTSGPLEITWRAVLRDGSHYLRTELELTASADQAMTSVTPLFYEFDTENFRIPEVVGNTRGAILASDAIFAGVESPMGINRAGSDAPEMLNPLTFDRWTENSFDWAPGDETPAGILGLGFNASQIVGERGYLTFPEAGPTKVTFSYTSGTHRLNIVGVDVVPVNGGAPVASDYHIGYTGNAMSGNTYTLNIPAAGSYQMRIFCETRTETITSSGSIAYSTAVSQPRVVAGHRPADSPADDFTVYIPSDGATVIEGLWSRKTTLQAGKTWRISGVVGLIAPGQARRSVLAYSERERAVAWRPFPLYNSWYELNIDRNNAAPPSYAGSMTAEQCTDVVNQWKKNLFEAHGANINAFVWDDGWDSYGTWTFNPNFPNGFAEPDAAAREMGTGIGAWLGPVGGYGASGNYRRSYWTDKGGMQLSNPDYYKVFLDACSTLINDYDFRFFKFDGISAQANSVGPDPGVTGDENAEGIIDLEQRVREIKPDIFLNTSVGTWASPFWFRYTDAVWRQDGDFGTVGNQGTDRERWITYRDRLVYQNFIQNSPLCPINTLMTHGVILTTRGDVARNMDYDGIVREIRCAFACGSAMVELYCDYALLNSINGGRLWADIAECIEWQKRNADVLPDIHWVGGNPWDGRKANVYGWASWNGKKATLALRNPSASAQSFSFTLREVLEIPEWIAEAEMTLTPSFAVQASLDGLPEGSTISIDEPLTVKLPASSVYVYDGEHPLTDAITEVTATAAAPRGCYDLQGRKVNTPAHGIYIIDGKKTAVR